jgi:ATP-dependent DNA helicase RecG
MKDLLQKSIKSISGLGDTRFKLLQKINVNTISDLIFRFPVRYEDTSNIYSIRSFLGADIESGTVLVNILDIKNIFIRSGLTIQNFLLQDFSAPDRLTIKSFNQPFLANNFDRKIPYFVKIKRKVNKYGKYEYLFLDMEKQVETGQLHVGTISPVYKVTKGISVKMYRRILLSAIKFIKNQLDGSTIIKNKYIELSFLDIIAVHFPKDLDTLDLIVKKLSRIEIATLYLKLYLSKAKQSKQKKNYQLNKDFSPSAFQSILNFKLSHDQLHILNLIYEKYKSNLSFNYLVQGDVGSGKSIVAFYALILNYLSGTKSIMLAPTTVLVEQHYNNLAKICSKIDIPIYKIDRNNKINIISEKEGIFIGTTAIQYLELNNIGLVVIDEQQKFGVIQREKKYLSDDITLSDNKSMSKFIPNFIEMTATPIPRTLLRFLFDDIETLTINTMPFGERDVKTYIVRKDKSKEFLAKLVSKLENHELNKVILVVPAIESENTASVKEYIDKISTLGDKLEIKKLTGVMQAKEKDFIIQEFKENKINILVSTSIIEIGVDIPDADVIVIISPQMFGLSQLHQMRGRVGRNGQSAMCFLVENEELRDVQLSKLKFFAENTNGLIIAEKDLEFRGPGDLFGERQIGIPDLKIANFADVSILKEGIDMAKEMIKDNLYKDFLINNPFL